MMNQARIQYRPITASGHREAWARTVDGVDETQRGAKAFEGEYLRAGVETDLEVGQLVIEVYPTGSVKHAGQTARFLRVTADGLADIDDSPEYEWRDEFLSCRDEAVRLLVAAPEAPAYDLSGVPTEVLQAELARRLGGAS